ncbi:MAG: hypothetical protein JOY93_03110 [Acidobacteriales bacterium]|nr:hypothetical protein [Terriglobales bacterium]
MKSLATLLLMFTIPATRPAPAPSPVDPVSTASKRESGRWYLAENGHAVYCYGPVMMVTEPEGGLQRVATFCRGNKTMVPLKD